MSAVAARGVPQPSHRLRLPVPPPAARVHRARERDDAGADPARCSIDRARKMAARHPRPRRPLASPHPPARASCPAASSSASRSRARWCSSRRCCSPTSRPATSTARPARRSTSCSSSSTASAGSTLLVVTHNPDLAALMPRRLRMIDGGRLVEESDTSYRGEDRRADAALPRRRSRVVIRRLVAALASCVGILVAGGGSRSRSPPRRPPPTPAAGADPGAADADRAGQRSERAPAPAGPRRSSACSSAATARSRTTRSASSCCPSPARCSTPSKLREDIRAMWKMGFFADIDVEAEVSASGGVTLTFAVKEKPSIRKVLVAGNSELELDKINEVLDLELDAIVDISQGQEEPREDRGPLRPEGLLPRDGRLRDQAGQRGRGRRLVHRRREGQGQDPRRPVHRQQRDLRRRAARRRSRRSGADALSFLNDSGTYNQEAFERDLLLVSAHYWDRGYANVKVGTPQLRLSRDKQYMYLSIPIDEGPVFTIGAVNFKGDLIGIDAEEPREDHDPPGR